MILRLLIADDNVTMHKMVRLAFTGDDAVIVAVSNGYAAIEALKDFRPNIVLADVSMPGYNGYELCGLIRRNPEFTAVPVILLNGAFDPFDEMEATRVKASGHLTKPFDPSEMIVMVEKLLLESAHHPAAGLSGDEAEETGAAAEISTLPLESAVSGTPYDFLHVAPQVCESYLGPDRILEIFDGETFNVKTAADWRIPEKLIDRVAEKAAEKMFPYIETFIRQILSAGETT